MAYPAKYSIHKIGIMQMRLCVFFVAVAIPLVSCGTVSKPENTVVETPAPISAPIPEPTPAFGSKVENGAKNYLVIDNLDSYKKFTSFYSDIKAGAEEVKIAQLILDLRKKESINEIKLLLPRVLPLLTNNTYFNFYNPWVNELTTLANKKLILERMEYCISRWERKTTILFESHIELLCHQAMKDYILAKAAKFPEGWDENKIWDYLKRKPVFYFTNNENVAIIKKAITSLSKEQQVKIIANFSKEILPREISPHRLISQLMTTVDPSSATVLLDLNARKQQRRDLSQELGAIYATGGSEVDVNYYENVTNDLIQTTAKNKLTLGVDYAVPRLIVFADFLTRNAKQELSRKILEHVKEHFEISAVDQTDFYFNYLWSYITLQDYKSAIKYAESNSLTNKFNDLDSKLQYWIAHSYHAQKNTTKSMEYFKTLVNTNPLTYYAIMAMKNIKAHDESIYEKLVVENFGSKKELLEPVKNWHEIYKANFIRLSAWTKIGSYSMISQEYNFLLESIEKELASYNEREKILARSQILHGTAVLFNNNSSYLSTFRFMGQAIQQKKINIDFNFLLTLFPMPFEKLVKNNQYDVDHILLSGLIRQESGFDPKARSAVGATGLMQLMPYTARMVDRQVASNLTKPENNTSIGIRYLKRLLEKYDNNMVFSLAAYNAGDHRVNNWMKTYFKHDSILYNIESIPYAETRNYVKLIFRNMFFYKLVEEQNINDSNSFNQLFNIRLGFSL